MKTCTGCKVELPLDQFRLRKTGKPFSTCKACDKVRIAAWQKKNREKCRAASAKFSEANRERLAAKAREYRLVNADTAKGSVTKWREANRGKHRAAVKNWRDMHPAESNAHYALRKARLKKAVPAWANKDAIAAIYAAAQERGYDVDHIVPLQSKLVCGLHVEHNLRPLPRPLNLAKGNRHWPDMP